MFLCIRKLGGRLHIEKSVVPKNSSQLLLNRFVYIYSQILSRGHEMHLHSNRTGLLKDSLHSQNRPAEKMFELAE